MTQEELASVNKRMRAQDESHKWPISGKFNVTERAIRRLRDEQRKGLVFDDALSYEASLENEISKMVNDENNW